MATNVKDGWHLCYGYNVYVKNGKVIKAQNDYGYPLYPYHYSVPRDPYPYSVNKGMRGGWESSSFPIKFATLKRGIAKGTWTLIKG